MNWEKIVELIPTVIEKVRKDYVLKNVIIKDGIFGILEKHCNVIYYPLNDEKNYGFHTKRFVKDKLEDFVYINTAKSVADQVFTAAHELGHVWGVAGQVWKEAGESGELGREDEERIINRFAAELLMPAEEFKYTFKVYMKKLNLMPTRLRLIDLVQVMVMLMNDYMVPYESVRRRLIEMEIITPTIGEFMVRNENIILKLVEALTKDQNTIRDSATGKKAVPGLRNLLEKTESGGSVSIYTISKIKKDFDINMQSNISTVDEILDISVEGNNDGED